MCSNIVFPLDHASKAVREIYSFASRICYDNNQFEHIPDTYALCNMHVLRAFFENP